MTQTEASVFSDEELEFQKEIHRKTKIFIKELNQKAIERDVLSRLGVLALLSRSHMFLVGDPGVGKTYFIKKLRHILSDGKYFEYLLNASTKVEELLGVPYDGGGGVIKFNTEDSVVDSEIVFLDEMFKGISTILNSLLGITSPERIFHTKATGAIRAKLISLFAASNEMPPQGTEALSDRILFRYEPRRLGTIEGQNRFYNEEFDKTNDFSEHTTVFEIDLINNLSNKIKRPKYIVNIIIQLTKLFISSRIKASDRKNGDIIRILTVSAFLNNRDAIDVSDLFLFLHLGWEDYNERKAIKEIIYNLFFQNKNIFSSNIELIKNDAARAKSIHRAELLDIFEKRINPSTDYINNHLGAWRQKCREQLEFCNGIIGNINTIREQINNIKTVENITAQNIFVAPLLEEKALHIDYPYERSFDESMEILLENLYVEMFNMSKEYKAFLEICVDAGSYAMFEQKK
ncbi:AAA family ATPase [Aquamicrobium sp.]|uniref:AAA family ATPase n=1 Tax=Aquamicrobium sp. TaxID=1872579 RepID=UPI0025905C90|nr:AAA family ATPase [Aquamicrobium sp.]MCK9549469.1 AAA family ATPase [Aquamicrobium sp.]